MKKDNNKVNSIKETLSNDSCNPGGIERFGVSIEKELLNKFDKIIVEKKYRNRSDALRELMRTSIVENLFKKRSGKMVAIISLVYDHHTRLVQAKLTKIQHDYYLKIISTVHVHLDHHNCLEVMIVKGNGREIQNLSDKLIAIKGVKIARILSAIDVKS